MTNLPSINERIHIGLELHRDGKLNEAAEVYSSVLRDDAQQHGARHNLGMILLGMGRTGDALQLLEDAWAADGSNSAWEHSIPTIAMTLFRQGHWEVAGPWLLIACQKNPNNIELKTALNRVMPRDYLTPEIYDAQLERNLKRYSPRESATYIYAIDIVGNCNLRCPTCPVGNFPNAEREKGFMPVELFRQIIAKIQKDNVVAKPAIFLFNWGEPLLHPNLSEIIRIIHDAGFASHLSTNLNVERGLKELVKSNPSDLKISISGLTPETYSKTHVRGDISLVKSNMYLLRYYMNRYKSSTQVWVGHHIYRNNQQQVQMMASLCEELGFEHHPIAAFYQPIEQLIALVEGRNKDIPILQELLEHPLDYLPRIKSSRSGRYDCELRFNQTVINFDGTVALCCSVYDKENMLNASFLEHSQTELQEMKYAHPFCMKCIGHGMAYMPNDVLSLAEAAPKAR